MDSSSIRFVGEEDIAWFEKTFRRMAEEELGSSLGAHMQKTKYFVDFLRSLSSRNENEKLISLFDCLETSSDCLCSSIYMHTHTHT